MDTTLVLVRHAATKATEERILDGHSPMPLSDRGYAQAVALAEHLAQYRPISLRSSEIRRASDTAAIVGQRSGVRHSLDAALNERDFGAFAGLSRQELIDRRERLGSSNQDPTNYWEGISGVESDEEVWRRISPLLTSLLTLAGTHVLVTHASVMKVLLYRFLDIPAGRPRCFYVGPASAFVFKLIAHGLLELHEFWRPPTDL